MSPRRDEKSGARSRRPAKSKAAAKAPAPAAPPKDFLADFFFDADESAEDGALLAAAPLDGEAEAAGDDRPLESEYLSFGLGDETYALPIAALREIVRPMQVTEVPRTPPWVLGVVPLRGTVLPVLDLRVRLGLPVRDGGRTARILVVETSEGPAGLLTDRVAGVVRDDGGALEPPPQALGTGTDFIAGLLRRGGQMLIVLDYDAALRIAEKDRAGRDRT